MLTHRVSLAGIVLFAAATVHAQSTPAPTTPTSAPAPSPSASRPASAPSVTPLAHVEERGAGDTTLILIPGLSCDWTVYEAFMARNAKRYRMFAVTLPGFGQSAPPPLPAGAALTDGVWLANAERAILRLADERRLERPVVVGHSLGGHLALRLALHHPERFRAAVAIDSLPFFPPPQSPTETPATRSAAVLAQIAQMSQSTDEQWAASQARWVASMVTDPQRATQLVELCRTTPRATTLEYMAQLMLSDVRDPLANLRIPLLTISAIAAAPGAAAELQRSTVAAQFQKAPPQAQYVFFEDTRHFVMDDRPQELDRAIADFLDGRKATGYAAPAPTSGAATRPAK